MVDNDSSNLNFIIRRRLIGDCFRFLPGGGVGNLGGPSANFPIWLITFLLRPRKPLNSLEDDLLTTYPRIDRPPH
jgi:hypothetical protein